LILLRRYNARLRFINEYQQNIRLSATALRTTTHPIHEKIFLLLLAPSFASAAILNTQPPTPTPNRNLQLSCRDVDDFGKGRFDATDSAFGIPKASWDASLKDYVKKVTRSCAESAIYNMPHYTTPAQNAILAWERHIDDKADQIIYDNQRAIAAAAQQKQQELIAEQARQEAAAEARRKELREKVAACEETNQYKLYFAELTVTGDIEHLAAWRQNQAHEAEVTRVSGVRNLREERNIGEWIVELNTEIKTSFADYKRLGGK